jgi:NAD(P)-dependent dehydrogenase (short-subunit alcohol dehydrogenase family)
MHTADVPTEEFDRFYKINVLGTFNCIQAVGGVMRSQPALAYSGRNGPRSPGRGVIINMGSIHSSMAAREITQYTTSKHAVLGLTRNAGKSAPMPLDLNG